MATLWWCRFLSLSPRWRLRLDPDLPGGNLARHTPGKVGDETVMDFELEPGKYFVWVYGTKCSRGGVVSWTLDGVPVGEELDYSEAWDRFGVSGFEVQVTGLRHRLVNTLQKPGIWGGTEFWGYKIVFSSI